MSANTAQGTGARANIQKLITSGFRFEHSRHLILTLSEPVQARQFLAALAQDGWLVPAHEDWAGAGGPARLAQRFAGGRCPLSLGITFNGLLGLGLDARKLDLLRAKAPAFVQGAHGRAQVHLGDTDGSQPALWEASFQPAAADLLLVLHANTAAQLEQAQQRLSEVPGSTGWHGWHDHWAAHDGAHLGTDPQQRRLHFNLLDGLSQPVILPEPPGPADRPDNSRNCHRLGEFVLGYQDNAGVNSWRLAAERPAASGLPIAQQSAELAAFFKDSSFAAFRKIAQDESAFAEFVQRQAQAIQGRFTLAQAQAFVRAKLVGRWDDGQVVQPADALGAQPGAALAREHFDYSQDQAGLGCPFGAHIRRMNPRDDPVVPFRRRPILRRGMPYGPRIEGSDGAPSSTNTSTSISTTAGPPAPERGLLGLFFCANLEQQFEHLLGQWANDTPMGPDNRGNARDPLIGNNLPDHHTYHIPMGQDSALQLRGLLPFVTTKGTLYTWFPGLSAIAQLAQPDPNQTPIARGP